MSGTFWSLGAFFGFSDGVWSCTGIAFERLHNNIPLYNTFMEHFEVAGKGVYRVLLKLGRRSTIPKNQ